jgi:hypothetical protein
MMWRGSSASSKVISDRTVNSANRHGARCRSDNEPSWLVRDRQNLLNQAGGCLVKGQFRRLCLQVPSHLRAQLKKGLGHHGPD